MPTPPAHVAPFVRALGVDTTIEFLLTFGGAELYLPTMPQGRSMLEKKFGRDAALAVSKAAEHLPKRIPTAKPWIAQVLKSKGYAVAEIARKLHASDVSVRGWLKLSYDPEPVDPRQISLF